MKKLFVFLVIATAFGCDNDDDPEKFTSINGYWIVRTPDGATDVTFRIAQDADNLYVIEKVAVEHNGINYNTKPIDAAISVTSDNTIESITMVNDSATPPFFVVRFQEISVNNDFTEMQINISSFNVDGSFRQFPTILGTRK